MPNCRTTTVNVNIKGRYYLLAVKIRKGAFEIVWSVFQNGITPEMKWRLFGTIEFFWEKTHSGDKNFKAEAFVFVYFW